MIWDESFSEDNGSEVDDESDNKSSCVSDIFSYMEEYELFQQTDFFIFSNVDFSFSQRLEGVAFLNSIFNKLSGNIYFYGLAFQLKNRRKF